VIGFSLTSGIMFSHRQIRMVLTGTNLFVRLSPQVRRYASGATASPTVLQEVGKLQKPLNSTDTSVSYKTGQLFLHKQFGYRGVILAPWKTRVFEASTAPTKNVEDPDNGPIDILCGDVDQPIHEERDPELLYNVLVDSTDASHVRANIDGVSFLGRDADKDLVIFTMPGVDVVHSEDVVPYRLAINDAIVPDANGQFPAESSIQDALTYHYQLQIPPIQHELFRKFFQPDYGRESITQPFHVATLNYRSWQKKNKKWLKPEAAFRAENHDCGIKVTVIPFFMGYHKEPRGGEGGGGRGLHHHQRGEEERERRSSIAGEDNEAVPTDRRYWWRYILRVENVGQKALYIKSRSWNLSTKNGTFDKKSEPGLEGRHTVISPWNPCAQITCYCSLEASSGSIWGNLHVIDEEGKPYQCLIPHFILNAPKQRR